MLYGRLSRWGKIPRRNFPVSFTMPPRLVATDLLRVATDNVSSTLFRVDRTRMKHKWNSNESESQCGALLQQHVFETKFLLFAPYNDDHLYFIFYFLHTKEDFVLLVHCVFACRITFAVECFTEAWNLLINLAHESFLILTFPFHSLHKLFLSSRVFFSSSLVLVAT